MARRSREGADSTPRSAHTERKNQQLCKRVERVVSMVLAECGEDRVQGLSLLGVEPAAGSSVLRVAVLAATADRSELSAIREALERVRPHLRGEVAQFICRKRVPELVFSVVPG